jgi:glycosyltransferase involved in cell wall biosynthesis
MLEAMSAGCALVLSDTAPVREFAGEGQARLVDPWSPAAIAEGVLATLADAGDAAGRRAAARAAILGPLSQAAAFRRKEALFARLARRGAPVAAGPRRIGA